jgi:Ca2+-binding EF-hand superfamily protein
MENLQSSSRSENSELSQEINIDQINIQAENSKNILENQSPKIIHQSSNTLEYSNILDKMKGDRKQRKRLEEIISYMKVQKQPFHESELSKIFDRLDVDKDNSISTDEIKRFLNSLRTPINDFYIEKIIREFDSDRDGDIQKKEFLSKMKKQANKGKNSDLTELLEIFKLFDANHDEKICYQDLQNILKALGENFDGETCKEMMKLLSDGTGSINFSEFFELVKDEGKK